MALGGGTNRHRLQRRLLRLRLLLLQEQCCTLLLLLPLDLPLQLLLCQLIQQVHLLCARLHTGKQGRLVAFGPERCGTLDS